MVVGVESARLVALKALVFHAPRPLLAAAEVIFVALAASTEHPEAHWKVGVPVPPLVVQDAPVLLSLSEPAGRVRPPVT